jgi:hypothetical protein
MCLTDPKEIWNSNIDWNKDLDGIKNMIRLCNKRVVVTVPAGPPIFYGDSLSSCQPMLRRYDKQRMIKIHNFVNDNNGRIMNEKFYFSPNLHDFKEVNMDFFTWKYARFQLASPNCIWAFCIEPR